jgi:hypothetical protein
VPIETPRPDRPTRWSPPKSSNGRARMLCKLEPTLAFVRHSMTYGTGSTGDAEFAPQSGSLFS